MKISNEATVTKRKLRMTITTTRRSIAKTDGTEGLAGADGQNAVELLVESPFDATASYEIADEVVAE